MGGSIALHDRLRWAPQQMLIS